MVIKHLVLSGGGPTGLTIYGILKDLSRMKFWNIENIKTIYGTSVGCLIAVILTLNLNWNDLDNYLIKENWEEILSLNSGNILQLYSCKGLFDHTFIESILIPLLKMRDISPTVTLKEYFQLTKIELHMFSVNLNDENLSSIDISYKTHPNLQLIKAVCTSSAIPLLFKPVFYEGGYYVDGGLINNFPAKECLENEDCDEDETLFIQKKVKNDKLELKEESTILDLINVFVKRIHNKININFDKKLRYNIEIHKEIHKTDTLIDIYEIFEDEQLRIKSIKYGESLGKEFRRRLREDNL